MKKFKKVFPLLALVLASHQSFAQVPGVSAATTGVTAAKGNGSIAGTVVDATSQVPVGYATITLTDPATNKVLDGTLCDEKGKFKINNLGAGSYRVIVSFIGYSNQNIDNVRLPANNSDINLGTIKVTASSVALKEVEVTGQRALIEERVDRTVYNAEADATNRGGDASDVLRKVPMLSVDLDGNVSLRGSQNIRVLINNRPSTITAGSVADALKQIPADMIKSVEVITSPSAKYDAEGSGGIINIVTKKNTLKGGTLNIDSSVGLRGANLGLNGSYRQGKMGFSLGGFGRSGYNTRGGFENEQTSKSEGAILQTTLQSADTRNNMLFGRYTLGWDYDINEKNYITSSVQYGLRNFNQNQDDLNSIIYKYNAEGVFDVFSRSYRDVESKNEGNNIDVNLNFTHLFAKPQQELSLLTQFSRNNQNSDFLNNILNGENGAITSRLKNLNDSYNQESTIQLDYQNPINKNQMVEFGGKQIMRKVISDYAYFTAGANGPYTPIQDRNLSNVFNYDQNISAGYFSYTYSTANAYTVKAGARYEYTTIDANFDDSSTGQIKEIPAYGSFVPSINLSKKLKGGNTVKLAYNRRIQRPSLQFLNPNRQAANPLNVTQGNPELNPEYTNNFELGYNTYIKSTMLNFSAFVRSTNNSIQAIREYDTFTGDTLKTSFQNIGQEEAYGLSVFGNVNVSGKFTLNGGVDMYYAVLANNVPNPRYNASNQGIVANFRGMANYTIGKGWGLQGFGFYRANQVQLQGYQSGFGIYSLNLRKDINDKKGSIGFGAENFFSTSMTQRNELRSPILDQTSKNIMYNMNFKVNFSYRIGKMNMNGPQRRKKSVDNDDLKSGGEGGQEGGGAAAPALGAPAGGGAPGGGARPAGGGAPAGGGYPAGGARPGGVMPAPGTPAATITTTNPDSTAAVATDSTQAAPVQAGGLTGQWKGTLGQFEMTLNLQANADALTGTIETPRGTNPIADGKVNGNTFSFNLSFNGNTIPYNGKWEGNTLTLTANFRGQDVSGTLSRVE